MKVVGYLLVVFAVVWVTSLNITASAVSVAHISQTDFLGGTVDGALDANVNLGSIQLKHNAITNVQSGEETFRIGDFSEATTAFSSDAIHLNSGYAYTTTSNPSVGGDYVTRVMVDSSLNILYVGTYAGGVAVINTHGTDTQSDDTVVGNYTTSSTPSIVSNLVLGFYRDAARNLMYISTASGVSVINTQGTITLSDDTLVKNYTTTSTPAIINNTVYKVFIDQSRNLLYISTAGGLSGGLSVINTQGTVSAADDTLVKNYTNSGSPNIGSPNVYSAFLDDSRNLLYINTSGAGVVVVNTQGTVSAADDTVSHSYKTSTSPAIPTNHVRYSFLDDSRNLLYVGTTEDLAVINTQGTVSVIDDVLVNTYSKSTTPALPANFVRDFTVDTTTNKIYVATPGGVVVLDTKGTLSASNDEAVQLYTDKTAVALKSANLESLTIGIDGRMYAASAGGLTVIDPNDKYINLAGSYISNPMQISQVPTQISSWNGQFPTSTSSSMSFRTGDADAVWLDDFDDNNPSEAVAHPWGENCQTITEADGLISFSNPESDWGCYIRIDTGKPDNYFPAGSTITVRLRMIVTDPNREFTDYLFTDEWEGVNEQWVTSNEWVLAQFRPELPFRYIEFEPWFTDDAGWAVSDKSQIDWIKIVLPDSYWNAWSDPCTNQYGCAIDQSALNGNTWL